MTSHQLLQRNRIYNNIMESYNQGHNRLSHKHIYYQVSNVYDPQRNMKYNRFKAVLYNSNMNNGILLLSLKSSTKANIQGSIFSISILTNTFQITRYNSILTINTHSTILICCIILWFRTFLTHRMTSYLNDQFFTFTNAISVRLNLQQCSFKTKASSFIKVFKINARVSTFSTIIFIRPLTIITIKIAFQFRFKHTLTYIIRFTRLIIPLFTITLRTDKYSISRWLTGCAFIIT
ncbi:unnamed protein product [Paramecium octaurelia]|uniref:Uncharacterized protein n=1 Tax=Paramecium octaurelia TaxID=43137 RepID=A0A8S1UD48_PAROT|nr:unnamed protein product [Paramecium octaurelia]